MKAIEQTLEEKRASALNVVRFATERGEVERARTYAALAVSLSRRTA